MSSKAQQQPQVKKSKQPITLDIGKLVMQEINPKKGGKKKQPKRQLPEPPPLPESIRLNPATNEVTLKRGKERPNPKPKPLSKLKRIILEERERRFNEFTEGNYNTGLEASVTGNGKSEEVEGENGNNSSTRSEEDTNVVKQHKEVEAITHLSEHEISPRKDYQLLKNIPKVPSNQIQLLCKQLQTPELNFTVKKLLEDLHRFHEKALMNNALKAKKRYACGINECSRLVEREKAKCVILARNIEQVETEGGLDDLVVTIIKQCKQKSVPYICALNKKQLGLALDKRIKVSCVAILNADGALDTLKEVVRLTENARNLFRESQLNPAPLQPKQKKPRVRTKKQRSPKENTPTKDLLNKQNEVVTVKPLQGQWQVPLVTDEQRS